MAVIVLPLSLVGRAAAAADGSPFVQVKTLHVNGAVARLCFSPDGGLLVVAAQATDVFDTESWSLEKSFPLASTDLAFSPDGSLLATGTGVIEIASGRTPWSGSAALPLFSADGRLLVVGSDPFDVWDVGTWSRRTELRSDPGVLPVAVALSLDGTILYAIALGVESIVVHAWDIATGTSLPSTTFSIWDRAALSSSELFADGRGLAVGAWNVDSAALRNSLPTLLGSLSDAVAGLTDIQPIVGGRFAAAAMGGAIHLVSVMSGGIAGQLAGDPSGVTALAGSGDGSLLAIGGRSGRVDIWDVSTLLPYSCAGFTITRVDWQKGCVTIKNTTGATLDLLGWTISDEEASFTFSTSVRVEAGKSYVACPRVYNPDNSDRALRIDATDEAVTLYSPELCGATKASTKRQ